MVNVLIDRPDTIEELVEAMKLLDANNEGAIAVPELRWAMSQLGDPLDDMVVDEMIKELESENQKGYVNIWEFASTCFAIKEKKK